MGKSNPLTVTRETLDDGLVLTVQPPPAGAPSVAFTFVGPGGTAFDPVEREGLSVLDAEIAVVAAGSRDRRALARRLDALGATLSSDSSPECTEFTIWGPADRWEELLGLLSDVVLRPRFAAEDLRIARAQLLERQLRESSQPDSRADTAFLHAVYPPAHPYYRTGVGSRESVGRIGAADLRRFHRTHFGPRGSHLIATARVPPQRIRTAYRKGFRDWPTTRSPSPPDRERPRPRPPKEERIRMPGRAQVELRLGTAALARTDPRFPALFLANEVLGGRTLLSRLFLRIRERAGLAYHSSSELEAMSWGGFWMARAGTGPERAAEVERMIRAEFESIRTTPIPSAELRRIRESSIGSIELTLETTAGVHDLAVEVAYYGLPESYFRDLPDRLRSLSPREIQDAVAEAVDPAATVLVSAGP